MVKYHFTSKAPETNPNPEEVEKVTATYHTKGFESAKYCNGGEQAMKLKNDSGSLILIDNFREGVNKIHIGDLIIKNPHVERYQDKAEGLRVDLHDVDIVFAQRRLKELENWKSPEHREALRNLYASRGWYSTPYRLKQLKISEKGLDTKIQEMHDHVLSLVKDPNNTFISERVGDLELMSTDLITTMGAQIKTFVPQKKNAPKIIHDPSITDQANTLYVILGQTLDFIEEHANITDSADYWEQVAAWGDL